MATPTTTQAARGAYTRALNAARERAYAINRESGEALLRSFSTALADITSDLATGRITEDRAFALRQRIQAAFLELEDALAANTRGAIALTRQELLAIHHRVNLNVAERLGAPAAAAALLNTVPTRALGIIAARGGNAETFRSLYRSRVQGAAVQVDRIVESGIARGVASGQIARDLATMLVPTELADRLPNTARLPSAARLGLRLGNIDLKRYGVPESQVADVKSLLYNSRRIAFTEQANAAREANTAALVASPTTRAATWQRSGRHNHTDECDALATVDWYRLGAGVHLVERWPHAPHPFCMCMQGGPVLFRPVNEWARPRELGPESDLTVEDLVRLGVDEKVAQKAVRVMRGTSPVNVQVGSPGGPLPPLAPPAPPPAPAPVPAPAAPPRAPRKRAARKTAAPAKPWTRGDELTEAEYMGQVVREVRASWKAPSSRIFERDQADELAAVIVQAAGMGNRVALGKSKGVQRVVTFSGDADRDGNYGHFTGNGELHLGSARSKGLAALASKWDGKVMAGPAPEQQAGGVKTMLHEMNHARSPIRTKGRQANYAALKGEDPDPEWWASYKTTEGKWLEEGIVELKARQLTTRLLYDREYREVRDWVPHSYPKETGFMEWLEREAGESAVDAVWNETTHAGKIRRLGEALRPIVRRQMEAIIRERAKSSDYGKALLADLDNIRAAIDSADPTDLASGFFNKYNATSGEWEFMEKRFQGQDFEVEAHLWTFGYDKTRS